MAFEVYTYSPSEINLSIGDYRITGFEKISVSRNSPAFQIIKGIRGKNSRLRNRDTSCTVSVDIIQTSLANDVLSQLLDQDLKTNSVRVNLDLTDGLGSSKIVSRECFIESYPDLVYIDNISYLRWNLVCLSTDTFRVGGNAKLAGNAFSEAIDKF